MAEKITTAAQLKMLAARGKADYVSRISELAGLVAAGLESVRHDLLTVTLPSSKWSGRAQKVNNEFFLADSGYCYFVCSDADCLTEYGDAGVKADNITQNGQAVFHCEITPENDLAVIILRLEVEL